jgi:hypothetical protein
MWFVSLCASFVLAFQAPGVGQKIRVTDTIDYRSQPQTLTTGAQAAVTVKESQVKSIVTVVARLITPADVAGTWTVTYEQMTVNGAAVPDAIGHSYTVTAAADSLRVTAVAAGDEPGLKGAEQDLQSLKAVFFSGPACPGEAKSLCPALTAIIGQVGTVSGTRTAESPAKFSLKGTPAGTDGQLTGTAIVEADKWGVELDVVRRDAIPFQTGGQSHEAATQLTAHYSITRVFERLP